jgi:hypothetical protein
MKKIFQVACLVCASSGLVGCSDEELTEPETTYRNYCGEYLGTKTDPCGISAYAVLANPDAFNGKYVMVSGYYARGLDRLLFLSQDAASNSVTRDGFLLRGEDALLEERDGSYITVSAEFRPTLPVKGEFDRPGAAGLIGELREAKVIKGTMIGTPYWCWKPELQNSNECFEKRGAAAE